jgi:hypothetical protein
MLVYITTLKTQRIDRRNNNRLTSLGETRSRWPANAK